MNHLILGGADLEVPQEHQWVRDMADAIHPIADQVNFLDYRHWGSQDSSSIDLEFEIAAAGRMAEHYKNYAIIAKSIGTVVATLANNRGLMQPDHCFFLSFPLEVVKAELPEVDDAILELPPTTFVQNTNDPKRHFFAVRSHIRENNPDRNDFVFKQIAGDTHDYPNFGLIARIIEERRQLDSAVAQTSQSS